MQAYKDHYLHLWFDEGAWYIEKSFSKKQLLNELNDSNCLFYLCFSNNKCIGFLKLNKDAAIDNQTAKQALELERIYLIKEASNKGIGKQWIAFTESIAREFQKEVIWLKVMQSSSSVIAFYQKFGFQITGTNNLDFEQMIPEYRACL